MKKIIRGVHKFKSDIFSSQQELFERLTAGQTPDALFITCSDSRINPNLITQTEPGDLFILRNAGNIVPPFGAVHGGEAATIEYAINALGIRDIIICGHSHCGAMQGLLNKEQLTNLPSVANWLQHAEATRQIIKEKYQDESGEELIADTVKENVLVQLKNLQTHPAVAVGLAHNRLKLHGWVYLIETGEVYAYHAEEDRFLPVAEVPQAAIRDERKIATKPPI